MAFVPVLNSAFQMLNSSIYYARWYYMLVLMLTLATIRAFESHESDWSRAVRWSTGITLAMTVLIGFMPKLPPLLQTMSKQMNGQSALRATHEDFGYTHSLQLFAF